MAIQLGFVASDQSRHRIEFHSIEFVSAVALLPCWLGKPWNRHTLLTMMTQMCSSGGAELASKLPRAFRLTAWAQYTQHSSALSSAEPSQRGWGFLPAWAHSLVVASPHGTLLWPLPCFPARTRSAVLHATRKLSRSQTSLDLELRTGYACRCGFHTNVGVLCVIVGSERPPIDARPRLSSLGAEGPLISARPPARQSDSQ